MRLVFDLEADGLYWDASRIHCLVAIDILTGDVHKFEPSKVEQGLRFIMEADEVIGHNIVGYDIPVAQKLYPWFSIERSRVTDTLILSRLLHPDRSDSDRKPGVIIDSKLIGSHSLKAWGQRLGYHKADYDGGWETFSHDMLVYNERDTLVTLKLHQLLITDPTYSQRASVLEHQVAHIVAQQERNGFAFDGKAADRLAATLLKRRAEILVEMEAVFPPYEVKEPFTPKSNNKKFGYVKGVETFKTHTVIFNPGSRKQIADRLIDKYGWKPKEYTPDGSAKIDEQVLGVLKWPEAKVLTEYLMVQKRLGMLVEGDNAWMRLVKPSGRIHGEVNTNGAVTGRATHRNPNIAQVPAVGALYGTECRSLFTVSNNKYLVGVDVSGLELRMLAHFMGDADYSREVVQGDIHTVNMHAAGLTNRGQAKTFIYAFLFGGGDSRLGSIVGKGAKEGKLLKATFLEKTPSLQGLINKVIFRAEERGHLIGFDGRRLHIRSAHAALNVLLQSAGALICKQWMVEVDQMLTHMEWHNKVQQVAWVHDECQFECDPEIADEAGKKIVECIAKAGEFFNIKLPLTGEYKVGSNWAETH